MFRQVGTTEDGNHNCVRSHGLVNASKENHKRKGSESNVQDSFGIFSIVVLYAWNTEEQNWETFPLEVFG